MSKKPELYRNGRYDKERINPYKFAVWNLLYYRENGGRTAYKITPTNVKKVHGKKFTRYQLKWDLKNPWHVDCTYPKNFPTFEEAITYAQSWEAMHGPFKPNPHKPNPQGVFEFDSAASN